jgi:hypothetical protein
MSHGPGEISGFRAKIVFLTMHDDSDFVNRLDRGEEVMA